MLLIHQTGLVKLGEIVRYTVTYTPAHDRILPSPSRLHLKIKNTSAIALRAAFVHGPYTLYAAAYPASFDPHTKFENPRRDGVPEFEPNLKAGGSFVTELLVPEDVRETAGSANRDGRSPGREALDVKSVSWIIEVSSQVIFSNSAAVHYEILLGRDEKSLHLGFTNGSFMGGGQQQQQTPGQISDHQQSQGARDGQHSAQPKGIFSKAIQLTVDDTASLWNTPKLPERAYDSVRVQPTSTGPVERATPHESYLDSHQPTKQKRVHLVVLTHGLHSNLGADMLFLKESIDATAKQAKADAKARRAKEREDAGRSSPEDSEDDSDEEIIVRGFSGNAVRTERGIKYLGKRLAKYVLTMTYPDQPYLPTMKKSAAEALTHALKPETKPEDSGGVHTNQKQSYEDTVLPYTITSISFIAHSLGGLIQTYAVAYIQKHSPDFFDIIQPINFIALASPFLGLNHENPLYVKFALDFGLVGRTGQDLGLTWRAPTIARSGWGAIVSGIGESAHKRLDGEVVPEAKPLLRILPTGPAHTVLKKFRNRTVYSNVVNDGIVPLRTSCLLFLDWQSLGRVEKARRENGLVGTITEWGWSEITGANSSSRGKAWSDGASDTTTEINTPTREGHGDEIPLPPNDVTGQDDAHNLQAADESSGPSTEGNSSVSSPVSTSFTANNNGPFASLLGFFRPAPSSKTHNHQPKNSKVFKRSQTLKLGGETELNPSERSKASTGEASLEDPERLLAPPKTTFFESAGDLLKPPLPPVNFLIDPASRGRAIFHDRVYHPEDIPPPPLKKRSTHFSRRTASNPPAPTQPDLKHPDSSLSTKDYDDTKHTNPSKAADQIIDGSAMKVEEKIARAYHRDLSWRKVLVRLEPDAHNNIIVRRMFANAYGWPVIKHLCDTHFGDTAAAATRDEDEDNTERAKGEGEKPDAEGRETNDSASPGQGQDSRHAKVQGMELHHRSSMEVREATDNVPALASKRPVSLGKASATSAAHPGLLARGQSYMSGYESSTGWSERDWGDSGDDSDSGERSPSLDGGLKPASSKDKDTGMGKGKESGWNWTEAIAGRGAASPRGTEAGVVSDFLGNKGKVSPGEEGMRSDAASARLLSGDDGESGSRSGAGLDGGAA